MSSSTNGHNPLLLPGLDGSNPLAFLAALGTLRTLNRAWPDQGVAMSWAVQGGIWTPSVHARKPMTQECVIDTLLRTLQTDATKHPIAFMNKDGKGGDKEGTKKAKKSKQSPAGSAGGDAVPADRANTDPGTAKLFAARAAKATPEDRDALDWLSAMTSDIAPTPRASCRPFAAITSGAT